MINLKQGDFNRQMADILQTPGDPNGSPQLLADEIEAETYPITGVRCNEYGDILYDREGTSPKLIAASAKACRTQALKRAKLVYQHCNRSETSSIAFESLLHPKSPLTCRRFIELTLLAVDQSKLAEQDRSDKLKSKLKTEAAAQFDQASSGVAFAPAGTTEGRDNTTNFLVDNSQELGNIVSKSEKGVMLTIKGDQVDIKEAR